MFLGAGLVLSGCGDDDTSTTPAPAPPPPPPAPAPEPEPEPPAPEAPAAPTGLMVSATTETSITWTWDAVEGAIGYAVQVSHDEMFGADDQIVPTAETSFTASDLEPETGVYVRVAAAAGTLEAPVLSDWTTHVTGMSAMPPPEPEPVPEPEPQPDPVMVTFSLSEDADSQHFMIADEDDDAATAKASVNAEIMVESNTTAVITPMFVDGANGVSVDAMAGNMPFTYVDWDLLQSDVLGGGATFMVQRTTIGANQEMAPTGDVAYVTCGPFECQNGMDAPEISIANSSVCNAWDPTVEIQVGKVDNDVVTAADADPADNANDGVDLGIVTSSSTAMTVTHIFSGVAKGSNSSTKTNAAKGNDKTLTMKAVPGAVTVDVPDEDTPEDSVVVCEDTYDEGKISDKPEGCFRLIGPGAMGRANAKTGAPEGPDYLAGYSLELSPKDAGVTWGRVDRDEDPFEDLKCGSMTMMVADEVDICAMFDEEVDYAIGDGWSPEVVFTAADADGGGNQVVMWRAPAENSGTNAADGEGVTEGKVFKTVWFDDDLDGKIKNANPRRPTGDADATSQIHDLYNQNGGTDDANIEMIWEHLTDSNGDLTAGDLGKVDLVSAADVEQDDPDDEVDETAVAGNPDGRADNYETRTDASGDDRASRSAVDGASDFYKCTEDDGGDDDDGTMCDAVWTRDAEVTFADGTFGCTTTRMVSIKCTWDADGGMADGRNALPDTDYNLAGEDNEYKNFLKCEAE